MVFVRYYQVGQETPALMLGLVPVSIFLAWLTWMYVEKPARDLSLVQAGWLTMPAIAICLLGLSVRLKQGLPDRLPDNVLGVLAARDDRDAREECLNMSVTSLDDGETCILGERGRVTSALWGDSHAYSLIPLIEMLVLERGAGSYFLGHSGCPPLLEVRRVDWKHAEECVKFNQRSLEYLREDSSIKTVFISAYWSSYVLGRTARDGDYSMRYIIDKKSDTKSLDENQLVFARGLTRIVRKLTAAGKQVVVVSQIPEAKAHVPDTMAKLMLFDKKRSLAMTEEEYLVRYRSINRTMMELSNLKGVSVHTFHLEFCETGTCTLSDGELYYSDSHHLAVHGAGRLTQSFRPFMQEM